LIDVVAGGLIAALGGFFAVAWVRWRDSVAEGNRFRAAVLIVLDELGANEVNVEHMLGATGFTTFELYDSTFRMVELVLAGQLRPPDRFLLAEAYAPLRARWVTEQQVSSTDRVALKSMNAIAPNIVGLTFALGKIRAARAALAAYVPASHTTAQGVGEATTGPVLGSGGTVTKQT
jgi:hypothetical protein